jgi:circadian clock protein KaiC
MGPSGTGKSTVAQTYAHALLAAGETVLFTLFDENERNFLARARAIGLDFRQYVSDGKLILERVDPAELSPGELTARIRDAVERRSATMVVIDSLTGYLNAMPEENYLVLQMHEILNYLNRQGVVSLLLLANHGLVGQMTTPVDLTYLSDAIILLRFFESEGRIRRAMSVMKKRIGKHEDTIREFTITEQGLSVGEALSDFRGVLTGVPSYEGRKSSLMTNTGS